MLRSCLRKLQVFTSDRGVASFHESAQSELLDWRGGWRIQWAHQVWVERDSVDGEIGGAQRLPPVGVGPALPRLEPPAPKRSNKPQRQNRHGVTPPLAGRLENAAGKTAPAKRTSTPQATDATGERRRGPASLGPAETGYFVPQQVLGNCGGANRAAGEGSTRSAGVLRTAYFVTQ